MHLLELGLDLLAYLNSFGAATVADVARGRNMPRTTALRYLETLRLAGFLTRTGPGKRYRVTMKCRTLASGCDEEAWLGDIVKPRLHAAGKAIVWPLLLATPLGSVMIIRENTDYHSPFVLQRHVPGTQMPVEESASGLVYIAFCAPELRETVLRLIDIHPYAPDRWDGGAELRLRTPIVKADGYAIFVRKERREGALAVPVMAQGRFVASLALRYFLGSISSAEVIARHLAQLQALAAQIADDYTAFAQSSDPWASEQGADYLRG